MIEAKATRIGGESLRLEFINPATKQTVFKVVSCQADADRTIEIVNRDYMVKKLQSWLSQRMYAQGAITIKAAELKVMLQYHSQTNYQNVCRVVNLHRAAFESIAPGTKSKFYLHYINQIVPVLDDAAYIVGARPR